MCRASTLRAAASGESPAHVVSRAHPKHDRYHPRGYCPRPLPHPPPSDPPPHGLSLPPQEKQPRMHTDSHRSALLIRVHPRASVACLPLRSLRDLCELCVPPFPVLLLVIHPQ